MPSNRFSKKIHKLQEALTYLAALYAYPGGRVHLLPKRHAGRLRPDVVVGSAMRPRVVYLVTHGGAQNARQVKAWRDVYELAFYRTTLPDTVVVRVYFGEPAGDGWEDVYGRIFDGVVHVSLPTPLESKARELLDASMDEILDTLKKSPWDSVVRDLAGKLVHSRKGQGPELPMDGREGAPFEPSSLRRAVVLDAFLACGGCSDALERAGIVRQGVFGRVVSEPYVWWLQELDRVPQDTRAMLQERTTRVMGPELGVLSRITDLLEAVRNVRGRVPEEQLPAVLEAARLVLKASGAHSFGNADMLRRAGISPGTSWLYRLSRVIAGQEEPPPWLRDMAPSLAKEAREILDSMGEDRLYRRLFDVLFLDGAVKRRALDPMGWLVQEIVPEGTNYGRHPTMLDPEGRVATTRIYSVGTCGIHWKTAHMGRHDKAKELAARGAVLRPWFEHMILFLDGDWGPSELDLLHQGGWITYPWHAIPEVMKGRGPILSVRS